MFSHAVKIFRLQGFDIKVDPSWLLLAALITWSLSRQYFPQVYPDQSNPIYLVMAIGAMLGFFASLLVHELAHSVVARRYGVTIKGITLFLFGGVAELQEEPQSAGVEFWMALAGPATSLALALGFWMMAGAAAAAGLFQGVVQVLDYLALINLVLALFNLLPAFPLDGGRVLRAYLWQQSGDILKATERAARSGTYLAYALIGIGLIALFMGQQIGGLWQILIGGFLLIAARNSYQSQLAKAAFDGKTVAALMTRNPVVVAPDMTLSALANRVMLHHRVSFVPVVDDGVLLGQIDTTILRGIDRENWTDTRVGDVFVSVGEDDCLRPEMPVEELMTRITETGQRKFLVADGRRLLGVITLVDLMGYLTLSQSLVRRRQSGGMRGGGADG